jgi:hypothetical protein
MTCVPSTHVLGYDCDALRAEDCRLPPLSPKAGEKDGAPMAEKPGQAEGMGHPPLSLRTFGC